MKFSADTSRAFRCPDPLWTRFERLAKAHGCTLDSLVCEAIREFADRWENDAAVDGGAGPGSTAAPGSEGSRGVRTTPFASLLRVSSVPPPNSLLQGTMALGSGAQAEHRASDLVEQGEADPGQTQPKTSFSRTLPLGLPTEDIEAFGDFLGEGPLTSGKAPAVGGASAGRTPGARSPAPRNPSPLPSLPGSLIYGERTGEALTPAEVPASRRHQPGWEGSSPISSGSGAELTPPPHRPPGGFMSPVGPDFPHSGNAWQPNPAPGIPAQPKSAQLNSTQPIATQPQSSQPGVNQTLRILPAALPVVEAVRGSHQSLPRGWVLSIEFMGASFTVCKERYIIGRDKHTCDLTIKDPNVSRQHAMVEYAGGRYYVVDLGSTNGIEFQGRRINRHPINQGDVFTFCEHKFQFSFRYVR